VFRCRPMNATLKLDPDAVRRRATSIVGCIELPYSSSTTDNKTVCCFLVGAPTSNPLQDCQVQNLARLTIYCDTGTIATARVLLGSVRHTFRRSVTSLDVVERCLRYPAESTAIDWQLVEREDEPGAITERLSVRKNLELVEVGTAILRAERDKLAQHARTLEHLTRKQKRSESQGEASPAKALAELSAAGMEFQFSLAAGPMKHVDQCLSDINQMGKLVRGVATNGIGTVFLYGNGGVAYTPSIPRALYHRLSQLRTSKLHASRPSYVALGTKDRYFVSFHDGTYSFKGPKGIERALSKSQASLPPLSIAFGPQFDAFFLVFSDGSCHQQGRGIPSGLQEHLAAHRPNISGCSDLACVNLGPSGEWFVRFKDGRFGFGGLSREMDEAIQELLDDDHSLNFVDFGENGSYFVSYD
jgi:hypothetical protein